MAQPERAPEPRPEPERSTISGIPYESFYSPAGSPVDYDADLGDPGTFPYTRGIYETMYRGRAPVSCKGNSVTRLRHVPLSQ